MILYDPEPPEARVRSPRASEAMVKGPLHPPTPSNTMLTLFFQIFRRFWTAGGARGVTRRSKRREWYPTPLTAFARGQGGVPRAHLFRRGLDLAIFVEPEPPEARAGSLGEGRGRGRIPLAPLLMSFADPEPPEASAGSLGGVLRKGWVIPTPRAGRKSVAAPPCAHVMVSCVARAGLHHAETLFGSFSADPQPPEACARALGEGCERVGVPLTPHDALLRAQKSGGTAPFVEGSSLLVLRRGQIRPQRLRVPVHAKEKVYTYEGGMP
ncbi:hypothetical protein K525DRAFT_244738 [Schizophyllum commune Loenen D]|nr:hypothetical protein K525DRAFT_244738 [Schizophyllum commune Loenen D]